MSRRSKRRASLVWMVSTPTPLSRTTRGAAISDWYAFYGQTDIPYLLEFGFGGLPWETKETFEQFSPIEYAAKVTTPLLITHGEQDRRVPIAQAEEYYRTLKKLGNDVEFLRFPREGHGIREPRHRIFLDAEQAKWLDTYVKQRRTISDGDGPLPAPTQGSTNSSSGRQSGPDM